MATKRKRRQAGRGKTPVTALRLPDGVLERADRLVAIIATADPDLAITLGHVTRAAIMRHALVRGLAGLERRYASQTRQTGAGATQSGGHGQ